ncbi:hypothetical protein RHMOL_Rhmol02G0234300 [Rhododendron molle]|uniref:Uncharacterized protein n=1 Tax=Rhododendron molle TaxID=49168 RepID=A0ACC0PTF3_RHOML|nr:hypothetical protein RHMOL_Rhmol02G0234300 [Rhododendron molle]
MTSKEVFLILVASHMNSKKVFQILVELDMGFMDQSDGSQGGHENAYNDKFNSSSYSKNDIHEQKFDLEDDAHAFYNAYAKEMV